MQEQIKHIDAESCVVVEVAGASPQWRALGPCEYCNCRDLFRFTDDQQCIGDCDVDLRLQSAASWNPQHTSSIAYIARVVQPVQRKWRLSLVAPGGAHVLFPLKAQHARHAQHILNDLQQTFDDAGILAHLRTVRDNCVRVGMSRLYFNCKSVDRAHDQFVCLFGHVSPDYTCNVCIH